MDGEAAAGVHHFETVLVGEVVADEHRAAVAIGRLGQEAGDRHALGGAGRHDLGHRLAVLQAIGAAEVGDDRRHRRQRVLGAFGRLAPVQRDGLALVLDEQAGVGAEPVLQVVDHAAEVRGRAMLEMRPVSEAALGAVQARGIEAEGREQRIQRREGAAGDDGERAVEPMLQPHQRVERGGVEYHRVRPLGDIDEGAVEIEKHGEAARCEAAGVGAGQVRLNEVCHAIVSVRLTPGLKQGGAAAWRCRSGRR